jgi:hypothetical protein
MFKFLHPLDHKVEGYCKFCAMLGECTTNVPLANVNERASAVSILLSGTFLELLEGHSWTEQSFDDALILFALKYSSTSACQDQKRFMKCPLGLPSNYLTVMLLNRLQQFNCYIPYLPRIGAKFEAGDIREMFHKALLSYIH